RAAVLQGSVDLMSGAVVVLEAWFEGTRVVGIATWRTVTCRTSQPLLAITSPPDGAEFSPGQTVHLPWGRRRACCPPPDTGRRSHALQSQVNPAAIRMNDV